MIKEQKSDEEKDNEIHERTKEIQQMLKKIKDEERDNKKNWKTGAEAPVFN